MRCTNCECCCKCENHIEQRKKDVFVEKGEEDGQR